MGDEVVLLVAHHRPPQEDREVGGVAVEAREPRKPEEKRRRDQADMRHPNGARVEVERVEPRPGRRGNTESPPEHGYWTREPDAPTACLTIDHDGGFDERDATVRMGAGGDDR
ncbi:MAG: hypothetical protein ACRDQE_05340, partial [Gaiellales bacterium]